MMYAGRTYETVQAGAQRAGATWAMVQRQPSWVSRIALLAFLVLVALPIVLLVVAAFFLATLLFAILAGANAVLNAFRGVLPRSDGRENVRVIQRRGDQPPY